MRIPPSNLPNLPSQPGQEVERLAMPVNAKQLLREAVERLPEDATVEDAMDRLYFLSKVARGLQAADREGVVPHEEARRILLGDRRD